QVKTNDLFSMRLEKRFAEDAPWIEAINGGMPSTGTAYQYELWKEFFEPNIKVDHLVLCFFMGNDLVDNNAYLKAATFGETEDTFFVDAGGNISSTYRQPGTIKTGINYAREHSMLFDTLYETAYRFRKTIQLGPGANGGDPGQIVDAQVWENAELGTLALLKRWKSELATKRIPLDIVIIDRAGKVYNKFESEFIDKLQKTCTQEQMGCLRLKL